MSPRLAPLRVLCCYSHITKHGAPVSADDQCVRRFLEVIKGEKLNGSALLDLGDGGPRRKLDRTNELDAIDWFAEMVERMLAQEPIAPKTVRFVPVPDSSCTSAKTPPKTKRLAEAIRARFGGSVLDVLRFSESMQPARTGGTRDPKTLLANLWLTQEAIDGVTCVLVDDVVTKGGHLIACAQRLRNAGASVPLALTAATTSLNPKDKAFDRVDRTIENTI